jgi:hypothetical protein
MWNQPRCPSRDKEKCATSTKWNFILELIRMQLCHLWEKWMELEIIMISEISQSNKENRTCFLSVCRSWGKK